MIDRDEAFEELKSGHGLLRELPGVRVWGVDDGALVNRAGMPAKVTKGQGGTFNRAWVPGKG